MENWINKTICHSHRRLPDSGSFVVVKLGNLVNIDGVKRVEFLAECGQSAECGALSASISDVRDIIFYAMAAFIQ